MICENCGKELQPGTKFCPECGKMVDGSIPFGGEETVEAGDGTGTVDWMGEGTYRIRYGANKGPEQDDHNTEWDPEPQIEDEAPEESVRPRPAAPNRKLSKGELRLQTRSEGQLKGTLGAALLLGVPYSLVTVLFICSGNFLYGAIMAVVAAPFIFLVYKIARALKFKKEVANSIKKDQKKSGDLAACPCCGGTGQAKRFVAKNPKQQDVFYAHATSCPVCGGAGKVTRLAQLEYEKSAAQLKYRYGQLARRDCACCHGNGFVFSSAESLPPGGTYSGTIDNPIIACPSCAGKEVVLELPKKKNKLVALLLCLPLGCFFGIHCYYDGNIERGLIESSEMVIMMIMMQLKTSPVAQIIFVFVDIVWFFMWIYDLVKIIKRPAAYYMLHGKEIK